MSNMRERSRAPSLKELIKGIQKQMWIDFESRTAQLPTPGEKGLGREDVVREFLRHYLPGRFHVESGFAVDAAGRVSRQIDAIIYDHLAAPRFQITEGTRILPVEAVAGVVSVKSFLDKRQLLDAMENIRSVTELDRIAGGRYVPLFGGAISHWEYDLVGIEPVLGTVFAFDGKPLDELAMVIQEANREIEPYQRVQLVCVLSRGIISYLDGPIFQPSYEATARVAFTEEKEHSLPLFYAYVANGVVRKYSILVSFRKYMEFETVPIRWVE